MCGICGFVKLKSNKPQISDKYIKEMCDAMISRGPDGEGQWLQEENLAGFGHRRLSIIDLSDAASQPMSNCDGTVVITFNGEIYNYTDIRRELEKTGKYIWKTSHSDTEVIVHAYEEWGIDFLERLRGMFAIAIWDNRQHKFWLIRDRIGIKPIYYTIENDILTFASEIKSIHKVLPQKRKINEKAFYDYLSFLCTPCEDTLFEGIYKVRPGTWVCVEGNKITSRRYYDVLDYIDMSLSKAREEEIIESIQLELRTAVQLRTISDVPVGVFLSGGIDSSTNTALFSEVKKGSVKTFCVGYPEETESYQSEFHYAKMMSEYAHTEHYEHIITPDEAISFIPEMIYAQDEPIADPVCIPVYYVSKLARENGVTVAQVGEGSDELFWGYSHWKDFSKLNIWNSIPGTMWLKKNLINYYNGRKQEESYPYEILRRATRKEPLFWSGAEAFYETQKQKMVSGRIRRQLNDYTSFEAIRPTYERFMEKAPEASFLNWMSYADLNHRLPELLLMRVDKMSMLVSLECRVPFLDHKFVELAMSIPTSIKMKGWESKHILKKAVEGIIPNELIYRKKQGFGAPVQDWFKGVMGEQMKESVLNMVDNTDLFDKDYMHQHLENAPDIQDWFLYNLSLWWKKYIA